MSQVHRQKYLTCLEVHFSLNAILGSIEKLGQLGVVQAEDIACKALFLMLWKFS